MKTHSIQHCRALGPAALAVILSLALAPLSHAKDKGGPGKHGGPPGNPGHGGGKHEAPGPKHEPKAMQKFEPKHEPKFEQKHAPKPEPQHAPKFEKMPKPKVVVVKPQPRVVVVKPPPHDERRRVTYMAVPRSGFVLSPGIGYAGRGYYYGPPNSPYYYETPDVRYFSRREDFPSGYAFQPNNQYVADELAVQEALARLGYYQGPIDGRIGPQTLAAIARYQQDRGMPITNSIVPALLQALGLQ
ncbi:peptidoglycan-binding protein [Prosthecobacter sp.]|uniref:peptidoglycan-binding protein n=1 Tax=Prosthecobacter sp. TaxID=1965333 RepID=UPI003784C114